jgi:hypothetical protein
MNVRGKERQLARFRFSIDIGERRAGRLCHICSFWDRYLDQTSSRIALVLPIDTNM